VHDDIADRNLFDDIFKVFVVSLLLCIKSLDRFLAECMFAKGTRTDVF
jgi:hypothetical protein